MITKILGLLQGNQREENSSPFSKVQLATCALLLEVAHSDGEYQAVEAKIVNDLLAKKFDLAPAAIAQLVEHAQDHRAETHHLFQFAREINAHFGNDEKLEIMECVWQIIYADSTLDKFEDALARQLATLLRLPHKDVIDRKVKVLNKVRDRQPDS